MKSFNLSSNSLHFRFATLYGPASHFAIVQGYYDLCSYIRAVLLGMFVALIGTAIGGLVIGLTIGDIAAWVSAMAHLGQWIDPEPGSVITMIASGIASVIVAMIYTHRRYKQWKETRPCQPVTAPSKPSFAQIAYESLHNRFCGTISVDDAE
jgi:hypothetical protein